MSSKKRTSGWTSASVSMMSRAAQAISRGLRPPSRDSRRRLDHLGQRPVGHALPVRQTAAGEDARALDSVEELPSEAALPDSGLSIDGEDVRATVAGDARERVLQQLELRIPAAEHRGRADRTSGPVDGIDHAPGTSRAIEALELERSCVLDHEARR